MPLAIKMSPWGAVYLTRDTQIQASSRLSNALFAKAAFKEENVILWKTAAASRLADRGKLGKAAT